MKSLRNFWRDLLCKRSWYMYAIHKACGNTRKADYWLDKLESDAGWYEPPRCP